MKDIDKLLNAIPAGQEPYYIAGAILVLIVGYVILK